MLGKDGKVDKKWLEWKKICAKTNEMHRQTHIGKMAYFMDYFADMMNIKNEEGLKKAHDVFIWGLNEIKKTTDYEIDRYGVEDSVDEANQTNILSAILENGNIITDKDMPLMVLLIALNKPDYEEIVKNLQVKLAPGELITWLNNENYIDKVKLIIQYQLYSNQSKGGRPPKLTIEDMINATTEYLSTKTSFLELGKKYNLSESNMYETVNRIIKPLIKMEIIHTNKLAEIVVNLELLDVIYRSYEAIQKK